MCDKLNCEVCKCSYRYPPKCRYYLEFRNCKFSDYCHFSHKTIESVETSEEKNNMKKEIEWMKKNILSIENKVKIKDSEIDKQLQ